MCVLSHILKVICRGTQKSYIFNFKKNIHFLIIFAKNRKLTNFISKGKWAIVLRIDMYLGTMLVVADIFFQNDNCYSFGSIECTRSMWCYLEVRGAKVSKANCRLLYRKNMHLMGTFVAYSQTSYVCYYLEVEIVTVCLIIWIL